MNHESLPPEGDDSFEEIRSVLPLFEVPEVPIEFGSKVLEAWEQESVAETEVISLSERANRTVKPFSRQSQFTYLAWAAAVLLFLGGGQWWLSSRLGTSQTIVAQKAPASPNDMLQQMILSDAVSKKPICHKASNRVRCVQEARKMGFFIAQAKATSVGKARNTLPSTPGLPNSLQAPATISMQAFVEHTQ